MRESSALVPAEIVDFRRFSRMPISIIAAGFLLLVKRGSKGEIIGTAATRDLLAWLVLLDAALYLQEEEARYRSRIAERRGGEREETPPLYSLLDALNTFDRFRTQCDL